MADIDYEAQYNNPRMVPDYQEIGARWAAASATALKELTAELDLPYGPGERNKFDLFLTSKRSMTVPLVAYIHGGVWQRDGLAYAVGNDVAGRVRGPLQGPRPHTTSCRCGGPAHHTGSAGASEERTDGETGSP